MALFKKSQPAPEEMAPPINLTPHGGATPLEDQKNGVLARNNFGPGYLLAQRMLADALDRRADTTMLELTPQGVAVRYSIDGLWMNAAALDPMSGMALLGSLKTLAALNAQDHRGQQRGQFGAEYRKRKHTCRLTTVGIPPQAPQGVRVTVVVDDPKGAKLQSPADLGMREKMAEQAVGLFNLNKGLLLVATPPGGGQSTLFNAAIRASDRFVRNFAEVQEKGSIDKAVENVPVTTFDPAAGETPLTVLPKLVRTYPDVLVFREFPSAELVNYLLDQIEDGRLVIGAVRARETVEAIERVLSLGVDPRRLADALAGVLAGRLVRTLCDQCKRPYQPPPQLLMQLGIPPGKVAAFYAHHEGPLPPATEKEEPRMCGNCMGMGFRGRTGVFELLVPNDAFRQALAARPPLDALRNAARATGMRTMQEEGIVLVAKGVTELPELMRVLQSPTG